MAHLRPAVKYYRLKILEKEEKLSFPLDRITTGTSNLSIHSHKASTVTVDKKRKLSPQPDEKKSKPTLNAIEMSTDSSDDECFTEEIFTKGSALSKEGPAPFVGDILDHPELLWTEDVWNEQKEREATERIQEQGSSIGDYWKNHYENSAGRYWHQFYNRNQDHFYKDRHYLHIVFPEFLTQPAENAPWRLFEVGCGVGNAFLPLLQLNPQLHVIASDIAKSAITILQQHILDKSLQSRVSVSVANIVVDDLPPDCTGTMDLSLCLFVLSAVSPTAHASVFQKLASSLQPGGKLLFRDYGRYDEAQLRFKKGSKLDENFYVRQDGTCSYFFSIEELEGLANQAGFHVEECYYILRQYANRQQKKSRHRNWIHAKFVKL